MGGGNLPIALSWNLIQLSLSIFVNLGHTGIPASLRAYWRHNTELNARWVSTDNCERHETFSQFSPQDRRASYRPDLKLNQPYKKKQGSKKKLYIDKLRDKGAFI